MQKFAVIGLGRFGMDLARALAATGAEVMAIDNNAQHIETVADDVAVAVCMDGTDEESMRKHAVHEVDCAVVGIGDNFEAATLTVAILKSMKIPRILARAQNQIQARVLASVGADEIVSPEYESALRWAHRLMLPNLREYIELGEGYTMVYMTAPRLLHKRTLQEINLRQAHAVNLVAIQRMIKTTSVSGGREVDKKIIEVPTAKTRIEPDDVLILVGSNEALREFSKLAS